MNPLHTTGSTASGEWVLALDTSVQGGGIALYSPASGRMKSKRLPENIRTSRVALSAIDSLMDEAGAPLSSIAAIATALGPGSFTGLRIGLATAKGLAFGLGRPLYGVSSMDAMAEAALKQSGEQGEPAPDWVLPCRDARHGELFSALYRRSGTGGDEPACRRETDDLVSARDEVPLPDEGTILFAGTEEDIPPAILGGGLGPRARILSVSAAPEGTARLAWAAIAEGHPPAPPDLTPIYGRKPRAETQWL